MNYSLSDLWKGTTGRGWYLAVGVVLFAIKHNVDRFVASIVFKRPWSVFNYLMPSETFTVAGIPREERAFYGTLLAIAVPFILVGVVLTLRRLRDARLPLWLVTLFFVPIVNLFFFLLLAVLPSRAPVDQPPPHGRFQTFLERVVPEHPLGSAAMGVLLTLLLGVVATWFSVNALENYGWGLFVGLPFFLGLTSVLVYGFHRPRSLGACLLISLCSIAIFGGALVALAIEGVICVLMAAPIGVVLALIGGGVGYLIQRRPERKLEAPQIFSVMLLFVPALMGMEHAAAREPRLVEVRTSVDISAPPERVWAHVVAFAELPPAESWLFKAGVAYPVRAEISGRGVGAVRHCVFSTGPFVEPIEVWDEPRLLRFSVAAQPPAMRELSPYGEISAPHLDDYLVSKGGQFLLSRLPDGRTHLEGTTWYHVRIWPEHYWQVWSDQIIHRIHLRVLNHVKNLAEAEKVN